MNRPNRPDPHDEGIGPDTIPRFLREWNEEREQADKWYYEYHTRQEREAIHARHGEGVAAGWWPALADEEAVRIWKEER